MQKKKKRKEEESTWRHSSHGARPVHLIIIYDKVDSDQQVVNKERYLWRHSASNCVSSEAPSCPNDLLCVINLLIMYG